jgi:hypothetical protein
MDPFLLTTSAGVARDEALSHEGKEFLMAQRGTINFEFDGKVHSLRNGDGLYSTATFRIESSTYTNETQSSCVSSSNHQDREEIQR